MADVCVLLVGHGSREGHANAELEALAAAYRAERPSLRVEVAYIELARPLVGEALTALASEERRIVVVPVFLFASGHVKNDLPLAIAEARRRSPNVTIASAPHFGVDPLLIALGWERASEAIADPARTLLLVVGRGSSDPDANGDFCKLARMIGDGRGLFHVEPAFMGITKPSVDGALELVARMRPEKLVVLPYLLFAGRLVARLRAQIETFSASHPWIKASVVPHLGPDRHVLELIDTRVEKALSGEELSSCDTCQYRTALPGLAHQVGGLRALLFSVRHTLTHSQAEMPVHLHRPLKKHVFVCGNADCADRGSTGVLDALRRSVKHAGRTRDIKITRTACMGRCGEGPTVAVYPDGIWYQRVAASDASDIVNEHLLDDRLVGRLVGDILQ